jgi:hypothetical protein
MPDTELLQGIEVGAGLYGQAQRTKALKAEMAQRTALFPYQVASQEMGLQAKALDMQIALQKQQIYLKDLQGAAKLGGLLSRKTFKDPTLAQEVYGTFGEFPHLSETEMGKYAIAGIRGAQQGQVAETVATIRAKGQLTVQQQRDEDAMRREQERERAAKELQQQRLQQAPKQYGPVTTEDVAPGFKVVYRPGSPGLHVINTNPKALTPAQRAKIESEITGLQSLQKRLKPGSDLFNSNARIIAAKQAALGTEPGGIAPVTAPTPRGASPPPSQIPGSPLATPPRITPEKWTYREGQLFPPGQ